MSTEESRCNILRFLSFQAAKCPVVVAAGASNFSVCLVSPKTTLCYKGVAVFNDLVMVWLLFVLKKGQILANTDFWAKIL